jgi:plastocyanin
VSEPVLNSKSIPPGAWRRLALVPAAVLLPAALVISPRPALAAAATVSLAKVTPCTTSCLAFTPGTLGVTAGDAVTWTDPAAVACTLRPTGSPDPAFLGGPLPGFAYVFRIAGTYTYRCAEYPGVHATLTVVKAAAAPVAAPPAPGVVKPIGATKSAAAKLPATAVDPLSVTPVVTTHTPWYVPTLMTLGGLALALLISQVGSRRAGDTTT